MDWNRRCRQWNADHENAWRGVSAHDGEDRLSPFQRQCELAMGIALQQVGRRLENRVIKTPPNSEYITAKVTDTEVTIWIHDDTAGFDAPAGSRRFEEWDYRTPDDFIVDFCAHVVQALDLPPNEC